VGKIGLLVDPYAVEALALAMSALLEDDGLKRQINRKSTLKQGSFRVKGPVQLC
jgi:glycosyltransferase involved in cell wall biosynthesis